MFVDLASESPLSSAFSLVGDPSCCFFIPFPSCFCLQTFGTADEKLELGCSFWVSDLICRFMEDYLGVSAGY